jgi:hypothetical protein
MHDMVPTLAAFSQALQSPILLSIDGLPWPSADPELCILCSYLCCLQMAFSLAFLMPVALYTHTVIPAENTPAIITAKVSISMSGAHCRSDCPFHQKDRCMVDWIAIVHPWMVATQCGWSSAQEMPGSLLPVSCQFFTRDSAHLCPANWSHVYV